MARILDPLLHCITDGDVEGTIQMFRDSHIQGYAEPLQRHRALCAAIRNQTMSPAHRSDIVRLLTCNIEGFDPTFEAGVARKNIIQIAFDENRCDLLPLLTKEKRLEACTFVALMQRFKLTPEDALQARAAIGLAEGTSITVSLDPLDLKPLIDDPLPSESDPSYIHRHFHFLRYLLQYCQVNAALLYRKSHGRVVAVSRNCALDEATGAERLGELFPSIFERNQSHGLVPEHIQTQGFSINGRHYSYVGALDRLFLHCDGSALDWAEFKAPGHEETLVVGSSRDLVVFAQFGSDINSFNAHFQQEDEEDVAALQRVSSYGMPGHQHTSGESFEFACLGIQKLLERWSDGNL